VKGKEDEGLAIVWLCMTQEINVDGSQNHLPLFLIHFPAGGPGRKSPKLFPARQNFCARLSQGLVPCPTSSSAPGWGLKCRILLLDNIATVVDRSSKHYSGNRFLSPGQYILYLFNKPFRTHET